MKLCIIKSSTMARFHRVVSEKMRCISGVYYVKGKILILVFFCLCFFFFPPVGRERGVGRTLSTANNEQVKEETMEKG